VACRVLVTGAGGFVGGHLLEFLRAAHPELAVSGCVRPHGGASLPAGATRLIEADLDDAAATEALIDEVQPDRVVHLAGQSSVHQSWADPGATLRTNLLGVVHLLDGLRRLGRPARVLVVGSSEEYGVVSRAQLPVGEAAPLRPNSPYAVSKVAQGLLALQYSEPGRLEVVLTRTFPHTGPGRGEAFAESSFARQLAEIAAGRRPPVLRVGNLDAERDFTDVRDVVRAYWELIERGVLGQVYNVCSGRGVTIGGVLERLIRLAGVKVEVSQDAARLRPSDIPAIVGDPGRLQAATGWQPEIPLERTLRDLFGYWCERVAAQPSAHRGP